MIDEGVIKFESRWQKSPPVDDASLPDLIRWRRPLYAAKLIGHYEEPDVGFGNLSARAETPGQFVISGTQTGHLPELGPEHFALVTGYDIDRNVVASRGAIEASSESMTHASIYELDDEIRAVVHVHSEELWVGLKDSLPATRGDVAYGTPQMAREFSRLYRESDFATTGVAVMTGHENGLVSTGRTVQEAAERILSVLKAFLQNVPE